MFRALMKANTIVKIPPGSPHSGKHQLSLAPRGARCDIELQGSESS
jgi:hypothetical protein